MNRWHEKGEHSELVGVQDEGVALELMLFGGKDSNQQLRGEN